MHKFLSDKKPPQFYEIKTTNGSYKLKEFKGTDFKELTGVEYQKKYFRLVQFYQIPTEDQRKIWEGQGMILTDYLSANTYYASIEKRFPIKQLKGFARAITPVDVQYKKEAYLFSKGIPSNAKKTNNKVQFILSYYKNLNLPEILADLKTRGVQIVQHRDYSYQIDVLFDESQLESITNLPYVQFIGAHPGEPINETFDYRNSTGRANYLNTGYNGLNYNGSGVVIGIGEGDTAGNEIDFKGRITEFVTSATASSHKIGCTQNAGGAGNLDPANKNNAWGATLLSLDAYPDYSGLYTSHNLRYTNHSYGLPIGGGYDSSARDHDLRIAALPNHLVSYSSGNSGDDPNGFAPYNFPNWSNITGAVKENKNEIAIGALSPMDEITYFSSRGPMYDGRIIPQLVVEGSEGTSFASPKVVGDFAILAQVYKEKNAGVEPTSSLLRAIVMNTADDLGNPGPDYIHGYGRPNLRRAYTIINTNQFLSGSVANGVTNNHSIVVPANVKQLRVMIVWPDVAAAVNANPAIVNNLNLAVTDASSTTYNPWVLDSNPSVASISAPATRGLDNLNTIEQVTIDNPAAGACSINVNGFNVPSGPQTYYLVYEFLYDELQIAFPLENQKFVSGETYYLRWDSYGSTEPFDLSYELNNSGIWVVIENGYAASKRVYKWIAPVVSGGINSIKFKVQRSGLSSVSGINKIGKVPDNFRITKVCGDVVDLKWSAVSGATSYKVYKLGAQYMEEVVSNITFSGNSAKLTGQNTTSSEYYAVSTLTGTNEGQRTIAIEKVSGDYGCTAISWIGATSIDWFDATNWSSGTMPTSADNVVIPSLAPFQPKIAAAGAVCGTITIDSGASLSMDSSTEYTLSVSKDWVNNGTFTKGIGIVSFVGNSYQEITGSSPTNFYYLKVDKVAQANILDVNSIITLNATVNPLNLTAGTFKLSSASTITPYTTAPSLSGLMGIWNNGGIINSGNFSWTLNSGLLRLSEGIINIGTNAGNSITYLNNGTIVVEGGNLNVAARIQPNSSTSSGVFNQSGGVITVFKVGSSTTRAPFEMGVNANFTFSGGTIVIARASSNASDYLNLATTNLVSGGTLQIGNASTPTNQTIRINSTAPIYNLLVNSYNSPKGQLVSNNLIVKNDLTIAGGTFDANVLDISIKGNWTNNGLFIPNVGKVSFDGSANQSITGATTFYNVMLNNTAGLALANAVTINNNFSILSGQVNLGSLTHSANSLTLGGSGTVSGTWGNTASSATNQNNTYFAATTGIVNVASCGAYWTGTQDTSWTNPNNWSSCGIPTNSSDVTINSGTFQPVIASNVSVNSLTIASGTSLTLNSGFNLNVSNAIANEGTLTIKSNANLIQTNNVANTGMGLANIERDSSPLFRLDYTMWSSPVTGNQTLGGFSPLTSTNRFYEYDTTTNLYSAVSNGDAFSLAKGYLIRMPNTWVDYVVSPPSTPLSWTGTFTGKPNNGTITYTMSTAGTAYNAVGNPYPSTLNIDNFINGNSGNITGALYFWRKTNDATNLTSYSTCTTAGIAGGNAHPYSDDNFISVGQGFIVKATKTTLNFTNSMRVANNQNQFFKTKAVEKNRIWLNLSNNNNRVNQMMVAYMTGATQEVDPTIDGAYFNDSATALNSLIANEEFAIQGRSLPFDVSDVVALAFKTDLGGDYTIAIDHADGLFANGQDVYLVDSKTGTETNLQTSSYSFAAASGVDNTRFSLKYQKTLKVDSPVFNENSVTVYNDKGVVYVNSRESIINNIKVYDIQGRLIAEQKNVKASTATINNLKAIHQVLIVKVTSEDNKVVSKKVAN